jgi:hypothetical protein
MALKSRGAGGFEEGRPSSPLDFDAIRKAEAERIGSRCVVEQLELGQANIGGRLREFAAFRYPNVPLDRNQKPLDSLIAAMVERMGKIPLRIAVMRYAGEDAAVPGQPGQTLKSGSIIGANTSKPTSIYPAEWFEQILAAEGKHTMDDLTTAITSPRAPRPFKQFSQIENLPEGKIQPGRGAGFLLLAQVDDRLQGLGLSQILLTSVLQNYHDSLNLPYVFFYGRMPELKKDSQAEAEFAARGVVESRTLNRYLAQVMGGERRDWGVGFHKRAGAHIICGLPDSVLDGDSLNSGYLGIYDLKELSASGRI